MVGQELPGVRDGLPQSYDNLGNTVPVNSNIPFVPISIADDPDTKTINAFMSKNGQWIPTLQRYQSDMHILTLRNGMLSAADRIAMATMTDPQRRALLLKNLGGEEPMPQEQWDIFFPKRGKIIKKMLMAEMPILEAYAKISPRMLDKQLKGIYKMATYQAQQGIVFANPVENPDMAPTEEVSK